MGNTQNKFTESEYVLKKSYYKLLSQNLKQRCDNNRFSSFNQNYALFQKDFEKNYINQHIPNQNLPNFIPWKFYLTHVLRIFEENKGYIWAHSLNEIISGINFPEQSKFQNIFFIKNIKF